MPKRSATTELNHDNWDQPEDSVDEIQTGISAASQLELKKRVLITGRRRLLNTDSAAKSESNNVFSSFAGFRKRTTENIQDAASKATKHTDSTDNNSQVCNSSIKVNGTSKSNDKLVNGIHGAENHKDENSSDKIIFVDVDKDNSDNSKDAKCVSSSANTVATNFSNCTNVVGSTNNVHELQSTSNCNSSVDQKLAKSMKKQFCKHLKVLNNSVLDWIDKHLKENAYLDLTPVFNDYIKHYKSLTLRFKSSDYDSHKTALNLALISGDHPSSKPLAQQNANFILTALSKANAVDNVNVSSSAVSSIFASNKDTPGQEVAFTFGFGSDSNSTSSTAFAKNSEIVENKTGLQDPSEASFSFPRSSSENVIANKATVDNCQSLSKTSGFSFNFGQKKEENSLTDSVPDQPSKLLLSFLKQPSSTVSTDNEDDNAAAAADDNAEYQPPKPDSIQIEEKDAFYSVKCKLFYKAGEKFVEKGLGTLHLKKLESGKSQLLIRTDTSLGNILLNVCLSESTPCSRVGKNNVSLACIPNPPLVVRAKKSDDGGESKVVSADEENSTAVMLIRVKTVEEAETLFKHMDGARKAADGK